MTSGTPSHPCPLCGAQSSAPRYWGHAEGCPNYYADTKEER